MWTEFIEKRWMGRSRHQQTECPSTCSDRLSPTSALRQPEHPSPPHCKYHDVINLLSVCSDMVHLRPTSRPSGSFVFDFVHHEILNPYVCPRDVLGHFSSTPGTSTLSNPDRLVALRVLGVADNASRGWTGNASSRGCDANSAKCEGTSDELDLRRVRRHREISLK